jgi:hypothetical protein
MNIEAYSNLSLGVYYLNKYYEVNSPLGFLVYSYLSLFYYSKSISTKSIALGHRRPPVRPLSRLGHVLPKAKELLNYRKDSHQLLSSSVPTKVLDLPGL